ncbi:hypothetical protein Hanom_Chr10g00915651 [Helianthus anomalus]
MFGTTGRKGEMRYECRDREGGCGSCSGGGGDGGGSEEERRIEEKECVWFVYKMTELERKFSGGWTLKNPIFYAKKFINFR